MKTAEQILKPIAYIYGSLLSIVIVIFLILEPFVDQKSILGFLSFSATLLVFVVGIKKFKMRNAGRMSLVEGIKMGLAIAAIGALVAAAYTYVHLNYITEQVVSNQYNYVMLIIRTLSVGLIVSLVTSLFIKNAN